MLKAHLEALLTYATRTRPYPLKTRATIRNAAACNRAFATVSSSIIGQLPHPSEPNEKHFSEDIPPLLDGRLLQAASSSKPKTQLPDLIKQYISRSGTILDVLLPYESQPSESRRVKWDTEDSAHNIITVAHCAQVGKEQKITLSSGFALNADRAPGKETLILTCAHTLEEIKQSPLLLSDASTVPSTKYTGSFIVAGSGESLRVYPVSQVVSALPRSDLVLLSCAVPPGVLKTLPVSPYPAHQGAIIQAHFVTHGKPNEDGWSPWIGDTWGKWHQGKVLGYRDFAGREAEPGTYDALSHLLFTPLPTAGSSGGPIIDQGSGAVVGVMLGTRMDNRVEGVRGWGVPSEAIFEMFALPGLEGKK